MRDPRRLDKIWLKRFFLSQLIREAYIAGFESSAEGDNGEYAPSWSGSKMRKRAGEYARRKLAKI